MKKEGKINKWLWVLVGIGIYFVFIFISMKYLLFSKSLLLPTFYFFTLPIIGIIMFLKRKDKFKYIGGGISLAFGIELLMGFIYGL